MTYSEFNSKIESLLKSKNYWLKNNILNFIDELLKQKKLTIESKNKLLAIKESVSCLKDPSIERFLDFSTERKLKDFVIEIRGAF